jgi:excisionase family DNA binding protein
MSNLPLFTDFAKIKPTSKNTDWLTTEEAATYLKTSVHSIRNMVHKGKLRCYKFQSRNRYLKQDLFDLIFNTPHKNYK